MTHPLPVAAPQQARHYTWLLVRTFRVRLAIAVALHIGAAGAGLGTPLLLGRMVDVVVAEGSGSGGDLDHLAAGTAALLMAHVVLSWQAALRTYTLGESVLARLRESFVRQVLALPLSTVESAGTGDLLSRSTTDTDRIGHSLRYAVPQFFVNALAITVLLAGMLWTSPVLTLAATAALPFLTPVVCWYMRRAPGAFAAVQARYADLTAAVAESADGARTVDALRWGRRRTDLVNAEIGHTWRAQRYTLTLRSVLFPALDLVVLIPTLTTLLLGAALVYDGRVTVGEVTTMMFLAQMLMTPVIELIRSIDGLQAGRASLARLVGVGTVAPDRRPSGRIPREHPEHDIRLQGVRFSYGQGQEVLRGIDLTLRRGERLALVGPTGAGKSTLARLIAGIHEPTAGIVDVGRVPLVDLDIEFLRSRVALITQEHHVFSGTLADNLRLAAPEAADEELERALASAGAASWVERLPHGLNTSLGRDRTVINPAQAQQVALARLLMASPATLVLDEATSMLSSGAARGVEEAMARVMRGRTIVAIAHRLHTAHDADRVAVVENGRITEIGNHDELLARNGTYARLWSSWNGAESPRGPRFP